jgi:hypothetical protein
MFDRTAPSCPWPPYTTPEVAAGVGEFVTAARDHVIGAQQFRIRRRLC